MRRVFKMAALAGIFVLAAPLAASAVDGAKLAEKCADCHGKDGNSEKDQVPNIAGFSAPYLSDTLKAYRAGDRKGSKFKKADGTEADMNEISKDLSDDDIDALASFFEGQKFKSHAAEQKTDPALVKHGEEVFEDSCRKCHSNYGSDPSDDAGILAGQWMPYLREQFKQFESGDRDMPKKMRGKFEEMKKEDFEAVIQALGSK
jgi:sulfide dehydrogenase cytochrome subunit